MGGGGDSSASLTTTAVPSSLITPSPTACPAREARSAAVERLGSERSACRSRARSS